MVHIRQFDPALGDGEARAVLDTLQSGWLTEGPRTAKLERLIAEYTGARHVLMVPNGTLALFAALKVLDIGPGDEVLVPDLTFFGTASAVILTGAKPVLVDVRADDGTIDVSAAARSVSPDTKAILPVHLYGQTADMRAVLAFADRCGLKVVEDAAQGMGVTCRDRHVGTIGDVGCMSFFADKTITTGEGGALLVNDDALAERCLYFKNQGRLKRGSFVHPRVGYNFRFTDLQAAIGVEQFQRLDEFIHRKRDVLDDYRAQLQDCPEVTFPPVNGLGEVVPFRIHVWVADPAGLEQHLAAREIGARRVFYPLHRQPSLTPQNSVVRVTPTESVRWFEHGLALPSGVELSHREVTEVCDAVREFCAPAPDYGSVRRPGANAMVGAGTESTT